MGGRDDYCDAKRLAECGESQFLLNIHSELVNRDGARTTCRMLKMAVQRGRSE